MFVVVALGADLKEGLTDSRQMHAFGTPTLVHFGAVLLIACILSVPGHTTKSLGLCFLLCGLGGLAYAGWVIAMARLQKGYSPDLFDYLWYVVFPIVGYAALLVASGVLRHHPDAALYIVGASALLLLYVGIHNSWDSATYMAARKATEDQSRAAADVESKVNPRNKADPPEE
jgi:hypothetical protein